MIRSKFLQQIKYQKTAGTAFAKGGAGSALVIAIGGTSSTAIKLQHCDTASGTFTDFREIVSATDAGSDTDVGVQVDIEGGKRVPQGNGRYDFGGRSRRFRRGCPRFVRGSLTQRPERGMR